ncbi:MAG: trehalose-6-phosphate synthase [Geminicoccaceae bacterium]
MAAEEKDRRLVVVSNRVQVIARGKRDSSAGGLAVGVGAALRETGGLWFGWSGEEVDEPTPVRRFSAGSISYALMDLTSDEYHYFYETTANRAIWPLFHYRLDLASFDSSAYLTYLRVNQRYAEGLLPELKADDLIWVHDYQLFTLGSELRRREVKNRIGFFLHIPWPALDVFLAFPWHRQIAEALCAYDVIGFQTERDRHHFFEYLEFEKIARRVDEQTVLSSSRMSKVVVEPIGIDYDAFQEMGETKDAQRLATSVAKSLVGRKLIVGIDRLDYSKGIGQRLESFQAMLASFPETRRETIYIQISAPSRQNVPEYLRMREEVEGLAGHINGRFGEADWVPLRYINRSFNRRQLSGLFKLARIGLVTPLRDGMNLVAKEFVAAQDPEDPGVLVLSRFAGAVAELREGAIVVNPFDTDAVGQALFQGLTMPLEERIERWKAMAGVVKSNDAAAWSRRFLKILASNAPAPSVDTAA